MSRLCLILLTVVCFAAQLFLLGGKYYYAAPVIPLAPFMLFILFRYPETGLLFFVFTIPFETLFEGNGFLTADKLIGFLLIVVTAIKIVLRQVSLKSLKTPLLLAIFALIFSSLVSTVFSQHPELAVTYFRQLVIAMIVGLLTLVLGDRLNLLMLARTITGSIAITACIAIVSTADMTGERATGFLSDPNFFALLLVCAVPLAVFLTLHESLWVLKVFWGVLTIVILIAFQETMSRSGLVILLAAVSFLAWHYRYLLKRLTPSQMFFCGLAAVCLAGLTVALLPKEYQDRILSLASIGSGVHDYDDRSLSRRSSYILVGWEVFKKHPFLGAGPGNFPLEYGRSGYATNYIAESEAEELFRRAHNTYLELLAETGLAGLFSLFAIIGLGLRSFWKGRRHALASGYSRQSHLVTHFGVSFLAIVMFFLFLSTLPNKYFWVYLGLGSSLPLSCMAEAKRGKDSLAQQDTMLRFIDGG